MFCFVCKGADDNVKDLSYFFNMIYEGRKLVEEGTKKIIEGEIGLKRLIERRDAQTQYAKTRSVSSNFDGVIIF